MNVARSLREPSVNSSNGHARHLRARAAYDDARPSAWPAALVLLIFAVLTYCSMLLPRDVAAWLIIEEHPIEASGSIGLLAGSIACVILWRAVRGDPAWPLLRRLSLLGFGLLLFFGAGEEESWGQRLLGIATPTSLGKINDQDEINLHNLTAVDSINSDTLFSLLCLVIGVLVPVLALWPAPRRYLERFLPVLPVALSGLFVVNQFLIWGFGALFAQQPQLYDSQYPAVYSLVEIKETVAELALGCGFVLLLLQYRNARTRHDGTGAGRADLSPAGR